MRWLALLLALGAGRTQEDDARRPTAPVAGAPGAAGLEDVVARSFAPEADARGSAATRSACSTTRRGRACGGGARSRAWTSSTTATSTGACSARAARRAARGSARVSRDRRFVVKELLAADHAALLRHGAALAARMAGDDAADADPLQFTADETRLLRAAAPPLRGRRRRRRRGRAARRAAPTRRASRQPRRPTGRARPRCSRRSCSTSCSRAASPRSTPDTAFVVMANALPDQPVAARVRVGLRPPTGLQRRPRALVLRGELAPRGASARAAARGAAFALVEPSERARARSVARDVALLRRLGLMDYSRRRRRAPRAGARDARADAADGAPEVAWPPPLISARAWRRRRRRTAKVETTRRSPRLRRSSAARRAAARRDRRAAGTDLRQGRGARDQVRGAEHEHRARARTARRTPSSVERTCSSTSATAGPRARGFDGHFSGKATTTRLVDDTSSSHTAQLRTRRRRVVRSRQRRAAPPRAQGRST